MFCTAIAAVRASLLILYLLEECVDMDPPHSCHRKEATRRGQGKVQCNLVIHGTSFALVSNYLKQKNFD